MGLVADIEKILKQNGRKLNGKYKRYLGTLPKPALIAIYKDFKAKVDAFHIEMWRLEEEQRKLAETPPVDPVLVKHIEPVDYPVTDHTIANDVAVLHTQDIEHAIIHGPAMEAAAMAHNMAVMSERPNILVVDDIQPTAPQPARQITLKKGI